MVMMDIRSDHTWIRILRIKFFHMISEYFLKLLLSIILDL